MQRINHLNLEQEIGLKLMMNHEEHIQCFLISIRANWVEAQYA